MSLRMDIDRRGKEVRSTGRPCLNDMPLTRQCSYNAHLLPISRKKFLAHIFIHHECGECGNDICIHPLNFALLARYLS